MFMCVYNVMMKVAYVSGLNHGTLILQTFERADNVLE